MPQDGRKYHTQVFTIACVHYAAKTQVIVLGHHTLFVCCHCSIQY